MKAIANDTKRELSVAPSDAALLGIGACIIEENDTHAVLAVRIPKDLIARNLRFLSALADLGLMPTRSTERSSKIARR